MEGSLEVLLGEWQPLGGPGIQPVAWGKGGLDLMPGTPRWPWIPLPLPRVTSLDALAVLLTWEPPPCTLAPWEGEAHCDVLSSGPCQPVPREVGLAQVAGLGLCMVVMAVHVQTSGSVGGLGRGALQQARRWFACMSVVRDALCWAYFQAPRYLFSTP